MFMMALVVGIFRIILLLQVHDYRGTSLIGHHIQHEYAVCIEFLIEEWGVRF